MSARLLELFRKARGGHVSGSRIAEAMGLTRAAVHKRIGRLREAGYRISGTNRRGYRLDDDSAALDPAAFPGRAFHRFAALPSTQAEAKRRALEGAPDGTIVAADRQTAGVGRLGRRWFSPKGGLWFSLVLRPRVAPAAVPALVLVAALDWARAVRRVTGLPARVKWPNDVWIGDRKAAGILTDMSSEIDRVHWVVLGVGVNVNNAPPSATSVPAVSLAAALGRPVSRQELLKTWLGLFAESARRFEREGFGAFRRAYEEHSALRGRAVTCRTAQGLVRGKAEAVDAAGRLLVRTGRESRALAEGDVRPARFSKQVLDGGGSRLYTKSLLKTGPKRPTLKAGPAKA